MKARMFTLLLITTFVIFASCGDDKKGGGTSNFTDQTTANAAATENSGFIASTTSNISQVASLANSFNGLAKGGNYSYTYNSSTGYWTADHRDTTISGIAPNPVTTTTHHEVVHLRFTERDGTGHPTTSTNQMEYDFTLTTKQVTASSSGSLTMNMSFTTDYNITGISAYRANTGNLTISGNTTLDVTSPLNATYTFTYAQSHDINTVVYSKSNTYPLSGTLSFTAERSLHPSLQGFPGYNVEGSITFNGTRYVPMTFGGYNYTLDLQTGTVTPA